MASENLSIQATVIGILCVAIGILLIGSLLAPIAASVMSDLTATADGVAVYEDGATWSSLVGVVVIVAIIGLVLVAVNNFTNKN